MNESKVDKIGDMKSAFEKMRFILRGLPKWMLPNGFDWRRHDNFCRLINPDGGATVTGEVGDNVGRSDRCTVYFVDEAAYLEHADRAAAALSQTTRCRIDISTPNGTHVEFYKKLRSLPARQQFRFSWRSDPRKDEAWYEAECKRIGDPRMIAQELDINHSAAAEGLLWPAEYFGDHIWFNEWPIDPVCKVMACDSSRGGGSKASDYSVWAMAMIDADWHVWVDCDMSNSRPTEALASNPGMRSIVGDGLELFRQFQPHGVFIESNGAGLEVAKACGRVWAERGFPNAPIFHKDHGAGEGKPVRFQSYLSPLLAAKRLHIKNTSGGRLAATQAMEYSPDKNKGGDHDDGPDAIAMCIEIGNELLFTSEGVSRMRAMER